MNLLTPGVLAVSSKVSFKLFPFRALNYQPVKVDRAQIDQRHNLQWKWKAKVRRDQHLPVATNKYYKHKSAPFERMRMINQT
jgi:hypothetical protein